MRKRLLPLTGMILVGLASTTLPLAINGTLEVTVYEVDPKTGQEGLLEGAQVIVRSPDSVIEKGGFTAGGQVTFPALPEGDYRVLARMAGYGPVEIDAEVLPRRVNQVSIALMPEKKTEVTVIAKKKMVQLEKGNETSTTISDDFLSNLPVQGREYQSVLTLAPGALDDDGDGNPNFHGSRESDFRMTVDGVSNVDPLTGTFQSFVNIDAIEEVQIIDSGADASYGGAIGAFGKIVSKTGSNEFEGTATLFLRDSTFDNDLWGDRDPQEFGLLRPAVFFSGPIIKDHLWFVVDHEYIDFKYPIDLVGGGDFVQKQTSFRSMDKVTWQVNSGNKLSFQYSADPLKIDPFFVNSIAPPETGVTYEVGGPTYTVKWTAPYSPNFLWEATAAFSDIQREYHPIQRDLFNSCVDPLAPGNEVFRGLMCFDADRGLTRSGPFFRDFKDFRQRWTYAIDAEPFIQDWLGGSHRIKFGGIVERAKYDREKLQRNFLTIYELPSPLSIFDPNGGGNASTRRRVIEDRFSPEQGGTDLRENGARGNYLHAYITDTFQPLPNLAITVGARIFREELSAPGYVPFDPAAERQAWNQYLDTCQQWWIDNTGQPVPVANCWASFLQGAAKEDPPFLPPDFPSQPVGTGFTYHVGDLPDAFDGACANRRQCDALAQANGFPGGIDPANVRQAETFDIVNNNLEPRISVAWDPFNDSKTSVAANWGRFHGQTFLAPLVDEADSDVTRNYQTFIDGRPESGSNDVSEIDSAWQIRAIDRDLKSQGSAEWGLSVEREIAPETSLRVRYLHRQYTDQLQDVDVNHTGVLWDDAIHGPLACENGIPRAGCCLRVGRFADCTGKEISSGNGLNARIVQMPDGTADIELVSPFFNNIYFVGNFNGSYYKAYILELTRRYYQNWEMQVSYTWSKAIGQAEDYQAVLGDDVSNADDEVGFLSYDVRHVVKLNGRVTLPYWGGVRIGGAFTYRTGTPYSLVEVRDVTDAKTRLTVGASGTDYAFYQGRDLGQLTFASSSTRTIFPTGRRNDQRNEPYWNFNVNMQKDFRVRNARATAQVDIFNVLNDDTLILFQLTKQQVALPEGGFGFRDIPRGTRRPGRIFQLMLKLNF